MASNDVVGFLRILLSANTAEFDKAISQSQKAVQSFVGGLGKAVDGFKDLGGASGPLSGALEKVVGTLEGAVSGIEALGPAGAAAAVGVVAATGAVAGLVAITGTAAAELYSVTKFAADAGDEMLNLHNKTGIAVEALSELKFVGEQADVPLSAITDSIFKLGQNVSTGGDKVKAGLKTIGLSFEDIRKLSPDKAFELVIARLHDIPDAGQRAAAGVALFGKGFKEVAQLAEEDMGGLIAKAHDLGIVMSSETAVAGDRFNDALKVMGAQVDALKVKIGSVLLPVAVALVETFGTQLTAALQAAGSGTGDLADIVANVSIVIGQALMAIVSVGAQAANWLVEFFSGEFITSLGLIELLGEVVTALGAAMSAMSAMHPEWAGIGASAVLAGQKLKDFADKGVEGVVRVSSTLSGYAKAVDAAATTTGIALPAAVARVRTEISKTADAMRAASSGADGFGKAMADGTDAAGKAAADAAKKIAVLASEIDAAATRGMPAGEMVRLFGEQAIKASDEAARFGLTASEGIQSIARDAKDLISANYYDKIADQARAGLLKIVAEEAKRQDAELSDHLKLYTANAQYEKDLTDLYRTGTDLQIAQIERKRDAELAALPVETAENKRELDIRKQQITDHYQWQIDAANGMYHTLGDLEKASGAQTVSDLKETADKATLLYEQMRDSGAFSARDVQTAWENSVKAQATAVGGLKGDVLTMYAELGTKLSDTLADMATHWRNWKDDLKKLWSDIAGDFTAMLAKMLKEWIEGFLMRMLASITGARGDFASAWSGLMPNGGGGGGLLNNLVGKGIGSLFGGAGAVAAGSTGGLILGSGTGVAIGVPGALGAAPVAGFGAPLVGAGTEVGGAGAAGGAGGIGAGLSGFLGGAGAAGAGFGVGALMQKFFGRGVTSGATGGLGGFATGALIGSIVPGIGTLVGGIIGGLSGVLGGIINFGPSKKELASRAGVKSFQEDTFANLTDAQRKEAQGAVASGAWTDPTAAGTLIAVRDAYAAIGKSSQDAERDVKALWDAEKKGPEATAAAMQPLLEALDQQKQKEDTAHTALLAHQQDINDAVDSTRVTLEKLGPAGEVATNHIMEGLADLAAKGQWTSDQISTLIGGSLEALGPEGAQVAHYIQEKWDELGKAGQTAVDGIGDSFNDLPAAAASAAGAAALSFEKQFSNINIPPIALSWKNGGSDFPDMGHPVPGFAGGTPDLDFMNFGRESLVRLHGWEAVVAKGDEAAFAAKHGGVVGVGGSMDYDAIAGAVKAGVHAALQATGLASLGSSNGQRDALDRVMPGYVPDMVTRFGGARRNLQNALGVSG